MLQDPIPGKLYLDIGKPADRPHNQHLNKYIGTVVTAQYPCNCHPLNTFLGMWTVESHDGWLYCTHKSRLHPLDPDQPQSQDSQPKREKSPRQTEHS